MRGPGTGDDAGFTLVEIILASTLSLVVLLGAFGFLNSSAQGASSVARRSANSSSARQAVAALDANLRYATGVVVCGGTPTTANCPTPVAPAAVSSWSRTGPATMFVANAAGGSQQTCDEWVITSAGLQEETGNGATVLYTVPGVMAWAPPLATAVSPNSTVQTTGFTYTSTGLVVVNLLVNESAKTTDTPSVFDTSDAVTVDDFITPDNAQTTAANLPVPGSC